MALRSIGKATLSFGLVSIPIRLYTTRNAAEEVHFHWLHEKCGTRVKQQYFCPKDEEVVERSEMVRGFEKSKGHYVKVTGEELAEAKVASRDEIDIIEFVPPDTVDLILYEHAYFMTPEKNGAKGFSLFARAMQDGGLVAIGRQAARGDEHIVAIHAHEGSLVLYQLRFSDEVRSPADLDFKVGAVPARELEMARELMQKYRAAAFDPKAYKDEAKLKKMKLIAEKQKQGAVAEDETVEAEPAGQVVDLMAALKASLAKSGASKTRETTKARQTTKAKKKVVAARRAVRRRSA
jgi:DNA end-binding protein Ku